MNLSKIFTIVGIVFASFIQVGCGTATPTTTTGYSQAVNGVCPVNTYLVANNQCAPSNTAYNNGYNTGVTCGSGQSYYNNNYTGACQAGYINQGSQCVCQGTASATPTPTNTGCQAPGYYYVQGGCYNNAQNLCYQGYVYVTPIGMCVQHQ